MRILHNDLSTNRICRPHFLLDVIGAVGNSHVVHEASISSSVRPLVSGTIRAEKTRATRHAPAYSQNEALGPRPSTKLRKVMVTSRSESQMTTELRDIACPRTVVG